MSIDFVLVPVIFLPSTYAVFPYHISSAVAVASDVSKSSNVPVTPPNVIPTLIYSGNKFPLLEFLFAELNFPVNMFTLIALVPISIPIITIIKAIAVNIIILFFLLIFSYSPLFL